MSATGIKAISDQHLYLEIPKNVFGHAHAWGMWVRRNDGKFDPKFEQFHGKELTVQQVRDLIPNVTSLKFKESSQQGHLSIRWEAFDSDYTVTIGRAIPAKNIPVSGSPEPVSDEDKKQIFDGVKDDFCRLFG
jgi:hypothetical protein